MDKRLRHFASGTFPIRAVKIKSITTEGDFGAVLSLKKPMVCEAWPAPKQPLARVLVDDVEYPVWEFSKGGKEIVLAISSLKASKMNFNALTMMALFYDKEVVVL